MLWHVLLNIDFGPSYFGSPVISGGSLLLLVYGSPSSYVTCFDRFTGHQIWGNQIAEYQNPVRFFEVVNGKLITVQSRGEMVAYDVNSGLPVWQGTTIGNYAVNANANELLINDDVHYQLSDATNGKPIYTSPNSFVLTQGLDDSRFYINNGAALSAYSNSNGQLLWNVPNPAFEGPVKTNYDSTYSFRYASFKRTATDLLLLADGLLIFLRGAGEGSRQQIPIFTYFCTSFERKAT